ncbi:MAG TPA: hypothetical protein DDX92_06640 [Flavobacteriales bacterium]|jgi:hypothetical protein|nr:hypothetical protein [Flavobacteriales bacterium]
MKAYYNSFLILVFLVFWIPFDGYGQKKQKTRSKFQYERFDDGSRKLSARIFLKSKSGIAGVPDAEVFFTAGEDSTKIDLGSVTTDEDGWCYLLIESGFNIPSTSGKTTYKLKYSGNDSLKRTTDDLDVINVDLRLSLEEGDETNVATIGVYDMDGLPVERAKVGLNIKRLYSLLPIGEERTDSTGTVTFEVPTDVPGDTEGMITLVARIDNDRKYGTVETHKAVNWGVPNTYEVSEERKNLWTQSAPLWMEVVVLGIFAVVGIFFFYSLYQVYLIPKNR